MAKRRARWLILAGVALAWQGFALRARARVLWLKARGAGLAPSVPGALRVLRQRLPASVQVRVAAVRPWYGGRVARVQYACQGRPVFGKAAAALAGETGRVIAVAADELPPCPASASWAASDGALETVEDFWARHGAWCDTDRAEPEPGLLERSGRLVPVYRILCPVGTTGYLHYVDARSGTLLVVASLRMDARGRIYPENPVNTPETQDATLEHLVQEEGPDNVLEGWEGMLTVNTHTGGSVQSPSTLQYEHLALGDEQGDFLYDPVDATPVFDEPFSEVNLYYHVDRVYSYFVETHGVTFQRVLVALANYHENDQPFDNAFFTPLDANTALLALGQGSLVDFGYDADVTYHEFSHFVIDTVAGLHSLDQYFDEWGRSQMPGALHEGLADYFSSTLAGDPVVGEYALGGYARDLARQEQVCPDDMFGEPHMDGQVIGGLTWAIRNVLGAERADGLIFGALQLLTPSATFQDFAEALRTVGEALVQDGVLTDPEWTQVHGLIEARGLFGCGRSLLLEQGAPLEFFDIGLDTLGQQMGVDCQTIRQYISYTLAGAFQIRFVAPEDVSDLLLHVDVSFTPENGDLLYSVYLRKDEMVHYQMVPLYGGFEISVPHEYDFSQEEVTSPNVRITLGPDTTPPLVAGATYYVAIGTRNCPNTTVHFELTTEEVQPPEPDAGPDASTPDAGPEPDVGTQEDASVEEPGAGRGCSCTASRPGVPNPAAIFLILAAFVLVRRKQRP